MPKEMAMKNAVVWSEIAVTDLKRATRFYEQLLDSELKPKLLGRTSSHCSARRGRRRRLSDEG